MSQHERNNTHILPPQMCVLSQMSPSCSSSYQDDSSTCLLLLLRRSPLSTPALLSGHRHPSQMPCLSLLHLQPCRRSSLPSAHSVLMYCCQSICTSCCVSSSFLAQRETLTFNPVRLSSVVSPWHRITPHCVGHLTSVESSG